MIKPKPYYHLMIINKNGGLMYHKGFVDTGLSTDSILIAASSFHGIDAISSILAPLSLTQRDAKIDNKVPLKVRIETIVTDSFRLYCYETLTGIKFVLIGDPGMSAADAKTFLRQLYEYFADYVLKDPFFVPEQLIKNKNFEKAVLSLVGEGI